MARSASDEQTRGPHTNRRRKGYREKKRVAGAHTVCKDGIDLSQRVLAQVVSERDMPIHEAVRITADRVAPKARKIHPKNGLCAAATSQGIHEAAYMAVISGEIVVQPDGTVRLSPGALKRYLGQKTAASAARIGGKSNRDAAPSASR